MFFSESEDIKFPEIEEYFLYTPTPNYPLSSYGVKRQKSIKITKDAITYCTSGLVDRNKGNNIIIFTQSNKSSQSIKND